MGVPGEPIAPQDVQVIELLLHAFPTPFILVGPVADEESADDRYVTVPLLIQVHLPRAPHAEDPELRRVAGHPKLGQDVVTYTVSAPAPGCAQVNRHGSPGVVRCTTRTQTSDERSPWPLLWHRDVPEGD